MVFQRGHKGYLGLCRAVLGYVRIKTAQDFQDQGSLFRCSVPVVMETSTWDLDQGFQVCDFLPFGLAVRVAGFGRHARL